MQYKGQANIKGFTVFAHVTNVCKDTTSSGIIETNTTLKVNIVRAHVHLIMTVHRKSALQNYSSK